MRGRNGENHEQKDTGNAVLCKGGTLPPTDPKSTQLISTIVKTANQMTGRSRVQGYNVLLIYAPGREKILMCKRRKDPYKGLLNLTGGKIKAGEDGLSAAYREMREETGITDDDIILFHLMDFTYHCYACYVEVYVGELKRDISVCGDENELFWIDAKSNFFDSAIFAGKGNIGHIVAEMNHYAAQINAKT